MDLFSQIRLWFAHVGQDIYVKFYQAFIQADRYKLYFEGLSVTFQITIVAILISTCLGIVLALMKISRFKILRAISSVYIDFIRGTPVMVQLLIMYMVVLTTSGKIFVSMLTFGLNSAAYVAEIVRSGINAVDSGQMEAGRSLGLSKFKTMTYIIMPQAVRNILPTYANEFIVLIKETSIVGYIGANDLTKIASTITSRTFEAFFPLIIITVIYLCITTILSRLFRLMERRLNVSDKR